MGAAKDVQDFSLARHGVIALPTKPIVIGIPADAPWPVVGRDPTTGGVLLAPGFFEAVAEASDLALGDEDTGGPRLTEDMVSEILIHWYVVRREAGEPACPVMDALIGEAWRESLH
jgi:hypothetical protein